MAGLLTNLEPHDSKGPSPTHEPSKKLRFKAVVPKPRPRLLDQNLRNLSLMTPRNRVHTYSVKNFTTALEPRLSARYEYPTPCRACALCSFAATYRATPACGQNWSMRHEGGGLRNRPNWLSPSDDKIEVSIDPNERTECTHGRRKNCVRFIDLYVAAPDLLP